MIIIFPGVSISQLGTTLPSERKVIKQIIYLPPMEMGANNKLSKTINLIAELNVNTQPNSYLGQHLRRSARKMVC